MSFIARYEAWKRRHDGLEIFEEEVREVARYKECHSRLRSLPQLPRKGYETVMQYLPVFHEERAVLLQGLLDLLQPSSDDIHCFHEPDRVLDMLDSLELALDDYVDHFGTFAVHLRMFGLPLDLPVAERTAIDKLIRSAVVELRLQTDRWSFVKNWARFFNKTVETPCSVLRDTLVPQLCKAQEQVGVFSKQWVRDPLSARISNELHALSGRLSVIKALGSPDVTLRECKYMFLSLNLPFDDDLPEDYPQSITFRQAVTLGLFETSRVRGYIWEDK
eukprot:gene19352-29802_t